MFSIVLCRQSFPVQAPVDSMMESGKGLAQRWFCARVGPGFCQDWNPNTPTFAAWPFLFTVWRKGWNCSLEALRKDAIIVSKTRHTIAQTSWVAGVTLIWFMSDTLELWSVVIFAIWEYWMFASVFFQWQSKLLISLWAVQQNKQPTLSWLSEHTFCTLLGFASVLAHGLVWAIKDKPD